jgi:L-ascorbate metabolism protein UlaG (beta-lactamase superfamily)
VGYNGTMKLTRFGHSCVLVETALPERRVALFDPGVWSEVPLVKLDQLDEIYITHEHADHCDVSLLMRLREKFPEVRIMSTSAVAAELNKHQVAARDLPSPNSRFFGSPHEAIAPFGGAPPEQIGVHYLDLFSHPGDSLSFRETCPVLALPMTGPWGATRDALALALQLKPTYIVPIHDWFWHDEARSWAYSRLKEVLAEQGIAFLPMGPSESYEIDDSQIGPDHSSPSLVID